VDADRRQAEAGGTRRDGLYDPSYEHDGCGIGFVANLNGVRSHELVDQGLTILANMEHRGACGADPCSGDGAGIMIQVPHEYLRDAAGVPLPGAGEYAVGMVFLPRDPAQRTACEDLANRVFAEEGLRILGWRDVPVDPGPIGELARAGMPFVRQVFIARYSLDDGVFARKLYVARTRIEHAVRDSGLPDREAFYFSSLSSSSSPRSPTPPSTPSASRW
jgi:glutamate synthase domain-containing protein 1